MDRYADDTPLQRTARRMVLMENLTIDRFPWRHAARDLLHLPSRIPEARGHAESGRPVRASASRKIRIELRFSRMLPTRLRRQANP